MRDLYLKPFAFKVIRYEEWQDQRCVNKGNLSARVYATAADGFMSFSLEGCSNLRIGTEFYISTKQTDMLPDRIQYGVLPVSMTGPNPILPIVCNIFNNRTCIRFAMLDPLRIIEFYGNFESIDKSSFEIPTKADNLYIAYLQNRFRGQMASDLLQGIFQAPRLLLKSVMLQSITHAMCGILWSVTIRNNKTLEYVAMIGFWCNCKAIERDPHNLSLYNERLGLLILAFDGMKSLVKDFILGDNSNDYSQNSGKFDFQSCDIVYKMEIADFWDFPSVCSDHSLAQKKKELDSMILSNHFGKQRTQELANEGREYSIKLYNVISEMIANDDIRI